MGYDEVFAAVYDRFFGDYAENAGPVLLRFLASKSGGKAEARLLDLGCGTGRLAQRFLDSGYRVTGLDLSPDMLNLAETRCSHHVAAGRAVFVRGDISRFDLEGPFDFAVSTYNSMNHLETMGKLEGCFKSVKRSLAPDGLLLFDYHTRKGLKEWTYQESTEWAEGNVVVTGTYEEASGKASMHLVGQYLGKTFDETLENTTFPLERLEEKLRSSGFEKVMFTGMENLGVKLVLSEEHKRVTVLAW